MGIFEKLIVKSNIKEEKEQTVDNISQNAITVKIDRNNIKNIASAKYLIDTCMGLVSAMLLKVQQLDSDGIKTIEHEIDYLLNKENHFLSTSCELKRNLVFDYLVEGNAYALVNRDGNRIKSIEYIKPNSITFEKVYDINNKVIDVKVNIQDDRRKLTPEFSDVIIIGNQLDDYLKGRGLVHECNELLEQSLHLDRANISSLVSNINLNGILAFGSNGMKREVFENLKRDFMQRHQGYKGSNVLLLNGMDSVKFIPTNAINQKDSQLLEQKELLNKVLLQSFGVKQIGDMDSLYKNVLLGIIENFEQSFSKVLLLESEKKQGMYIAFDTSEILRGNFKEHSEIVLKLFEKGLLDNQECRELLGFNRAEGKAYNLQSLGHVYKYEDDTIYIPNMNVQNKV
ncbi:phage portal protein [Terrisporobacter petrolearius]|uniref:phage portal protein n=1 Tax=Terrisporobacter petrolearius TaxID=1460447 RepID=UPI0022E575AA|nr:phage portal protein [Terrisporobacter petrolearius]